MAHADIADIYRLSPLQQGMLFHELTEPESGLYMLHRGYELRGPLSVDAWRDAWQRAMGRHPPLRSSFHWKDVDSPVQVVHRKVELPFHVEDWRSVPKAELPARMEALDAAQQRPFDLERAPLLRLTVSRMEEGLHYFTWTFHHILMEGWSAAAVLDEVVADYRATTRGEVAKLPERRPFGEYLLWLSRQETAAAERFWTDALHGVSAPTAVLQPSSSGPLEDSRWQHEEVHTTLSDGATADLQAFARSNGITLNAVVQGAWALLLSRYAGEGDVIFGTTVSGRSVDFGDIESMVGLFVNTLPARVRVENDRPLVEWLRAIQGDQARARAFEWCSLVDIHGWSEFPRTVPLFESILVFSNWLGSATDIWKGEIEIRATRSADGGTGYPLTVMVAPGPQLALSLAFDARRHEADEVRGILGHLAAILENMPAAPTAHVRSVPMLPAAERRRILARNETDAPYPHDLTVSRLFETQVDRDPGREAAAFGEETITYGELDARANRLAHYLRRRGVREEELVGLCLDRSIEMLVALLGVMKCGGAYLPIDPDLPPARIELMLEDAGVRLLVTDSSVAPSVSDDELEVVRVDAAAEAIASQPAARLTETATGKSLAYVIYTSGSTGRPKGVEIEHGSLVNFLCSMRERPGFGPNDSLLAVTTISFDISGLELFLPLTTGGKVVIAGKDVTADGRRLSEAMSRHGVTAMQATPATWRLLLDSDWPGAPALTALCGGEALPRELADRLLDRCRALWNVYGPTEATIWSTLARIHEGDDIVSIGRPIANTQVYVLDDVMELVPEGVRGELYIGGDGLARGYRNRPDLTAERFVPDPFSEAPGARLYRTGDVARYLHDGGLECLGRTDHQVKVRGFRIEPGEIEAALVGSPAVRHAAVVAHAFGPGDVRLVAYIVSEPDLEIMPSELRTFLRRKLPEYMIPSIFSFLDRLPLTPSGKVDRNALPDPSGFRTRPAGGRPPQTATEKLLAEVWRQALNVEAVHAEDNFFDLGGHSLLAMQVAVKMERRLGRRVNPLKLAFLNLSQFAHECDGVEA